MILDNLEGISGFRWGALVSPEGKVLLSDDCPKVSDKKIVLINLALTQVPFSFDAADLSFDSAKVLLRRGPFGLLLIFCDESINTSMVDILLTEKSKGLTWSTPEPPRNDKTKSLDSNLSMVTTIDLSDDPVPNEVIDELLGIYAEFLGPLARKLAQKDAKNKGINLKRMSAKKWSILLNTMADRFEQDTKREAFLDRAIYLKTKF